MAKILGYIDTVVSPYNSGTSTAGFTNIDVTNDADILNRLCHYTLNLL